MVPFQPTYHYVHHSYNKDTTTSVNFMDIITLFLVWRFHINDPLNHVNGHISITYSHTWQRWYILLSKDFIFTFFMYQLEGHKSTKTRHTYNHLITCTIRFKYHIRITKSTTSHPIHSYRNINIVNYKTHIVNKDESYFKIKYTHISTSL